MLNRLKHGSRSSGTVVLGHSGRRDPLGRCPDRVRSRCRGGGVFLQRFAATGLGGQKRFGKRLVHSGSKSHRASLSPRQPEMHNIYHVSKWLEWTPIFGSTILYGWE